MIKNTFLSVIIFSCTTLCYSALSSTASTKQIQSELSHESDIAGNKVSITYVGNAGFLINIGDKKILIDALFKGFAGAYELPQNIQEKLKLGEAPFDKVNLILVTHAHGDHIDLDMVRQHMKNNPEVVFASTEQLVNAFKDFPERSVGFNPEKGRSELKDINGISIETFYLPHGPDSRILNIGFLVKVNGITFFQTGDVDFDQFTFDEFRSLHLPEKKIDLAFIQHFYLTNDSLSTKFVQEAIGGKYIIPIHYHFTTPVFDSTIVRQNYPDAILFNEEMESWSMPGKENVFSELKGNYFGQSLPGNTPVVFAPGIISVDSTIEHGAPLFAPDGNTVFWQSNLRHKDQETDIFLYIMHRIDGRWTAPEISPYGGMPAFSPDGTQLYFKAPAHLEEKDIYLIEKEGKNWSEPRRIDIIARNPELKYLHGPSVTTNGTLYFFSYAEGLGSRNGFGIYRSELINGIYAKPELLPPSINTGDGVLNWTPYISPDESYLLFSSSRSTPDTDFGDIFICFRSSDGSWTEAKSLGASINTTSQERFPWISPDGKYLFFTRWVTPGNEDVFWVRTGIIEELREKCLK